jgi:hypothetical protein
MGWHCSVWLGVLFQIHPWGMDTCFPLLVLSIQLYCIYMSSYKYLGFFNEIGNNGRHVFLVSKGWPASLIAHFERQKCTSVVYIHDTCRALSIAVANVRRVQVEWITWKTFIHPKSQIDNQSEKVISSLTMRNVKGQPQMT